MQPHSQTSNTSMQSGDPLVFSLPPNPDMLSKRAEKYQQVMKVAYPNQSSNPITAGFPPVVHPPQTRGPGSGGGPSLVIPSQNPSQHAPPPQQNQPAASVQPQPTSSLAGTTDQHKDGKRKVPVKKAEPQRKRVPMSDEDDAAGEDDDGNQDGDDEDQENAGDEEEEDEESQEHVAKKKSKPSQNGAASKVKASKPKKDSKAAPASPKNNKRKGKETAPATPAARKKPKVNSNKRSATSKKSDPDLMTVDFADSMAGQDDVPVGNALAPQLPAFLPSTYPLSMAPLQCQFCHQWTLHPMPGAAAANVAAAAANMASAVRSPARAVQQQQDVQKGDASDDGGEKKKKTRKRRTKQKLMEPTLNKYRARMEALLSKADIENLTESYLSDFKLNDVMDASMGKAVHHAQILKEIVESRGGKIRGFASENKKKDGKFVHPLPTGEKRLEEGGTGKTVYVGKANRFTEHKESPYCLKKEDVVYATPQK